MFIPTTPLLPKSKFKVLILFIALSVLSIYPIYKNIYFGRAIEQVDRHYDFLNRQSQFYNPWQYRMLTPMLVEGTRILYDKSIDRVFPLDRLFSFNLPSTVNPKDLTSELFASLAKPDYAKYFMIYIFYRYLFNAWILVLIYLLLCNFVKNKYLLFLAMILASLILGNSVNDSDFTLHTYLDVILYLATGCLILYKWNKSWIIVISVIGALNRETSIMIPYLYFLSEVNWDKMGFAIPSIVKSIPSKAVILTTAMAYILFFAIFIGIRWYYGYEEQTEWKVPAGWPMIKLNLFSLMSVKTYFEMLGTFSLMPLLCLWYFRRMPMVLQLWFIAIVPIWFAAHWYAVVAYQSRLFLVPTFLIFLPMVLYLIESFHKGKDTAFGEQK